MAFKQIMPNGGQKLATGINVDITIDGCTIYTSASITKGYRSITEIIGHDGETASVVMAGEENYDVTINGYVNDGGTVPANGDTVTVAGYSMAWIDGVTVSETPEGATTFSATVHARGKAKAS
jgi:hypothetical protein